MAAGGTDDRVCDVCPEGHWVLIDLADMLPLCATKEINDV